MIKSKKGLSFFILLFFILSNQVYSYNESDYQAALNGEMNLAGKDLSGADFSGTNFNGTNLSQVNLSKAKFKNVVFENVKFENKPVVIKSLVRNKIRGMIKNDGASFSECDMDNVRFHKCDMDNVVFDGSTVKKLDIVNCNLKKCSFKDIKLEISRRGNTSFYLENNKLDGCSFTDSTFKNKYDIYNMPKNIMLRTDGLSSKYIRMLKEKGAHIPGYSIICNADLHEVLGKDERPCKRKQVKGMIRAAKNKKNNVSAVIYAGDLGRWGHKDNWDSFEKHYFNKLKKHVKKQFLCSGNHDRWASDASIGDLIRIASSYVKGSKSYMIKRIKKTNDEDEDYYKKFMNGTDFVSLSECPTMPNNKPINWFIKKIAKLKSPKILFYHYTPLSNWSIDWWTQKKEPRPTNRKRGKKAVNSFYKKIKKYKDKIILQVTGHDHKNIYKIWRGIPTICVGGNRFALAHIDTKHPKKINGKWKFIPEVVAIEFIHPTKKIKMYRPCLNRFDSENEKKEFILNTFEKIFKRRPKYSEIKYYVGNWKRIGGAWEIKQKLKKTTEFIKLKINGFYNKYLNRNADSSGLKHYVGVWKKKGKNEVRKHIKNSKEARRKLLIKWYKEYLHRDPDNFGRRHYLDNWKEIGGADKIEKIIKNSKEARLKLLKKWYKEYLGREPDKSGLRHYFDNWKKLGGADRIEKIIKNSEEALRYKDVLAVNGGVSATVID